MEWSDSQVEPSGSFESLTNDITFIGNNTNVLPVYSGLEK